MCPFKVMRILLFYPRVAILTFLQLFFSHFIYFSKGFFSSNTYWVSGRKRSTFYPNVMLSFRIAFHKLYPWSGVPFIHCLLALRIRMRMCKFTTDDSRFCSKVFLIFIQTKWLLQHY